MGMAGGAFKGDKERAQQRLQAAQIANQQRAQLAREQFQREQLAEQARQADLAHERGMRALEIQDQRWNGGGEAAPEQKSPVSVFSNADALAAARQAAEDRRLAALERQNSIFGQMEQVVGAERQQQAAKRAQGQSTMAALMKIAKANGGVAPISALNFANRQFGFDGKTRAIGAAGFAQNGDWFVDFVQKDQNGQISRKTSVMPFDQQGQVYYGQSGIFNNADRAAWRNGMLKMRYSTDEINTRSGLNATMIEGLDEAGRQRLEAGFVDPASGGDWKRDLAYRKQALAEAKFAQALGQKSLDPAQKYALYHFKEFGNARKATEADVQNGLAKSVDDVFMPTPKMMFEDAVQFYKEKMGGEDPATSAEGRDPAVVDGAAPQFGLRNDGKTHKGTGWLGELKLPNGGVATEYTMQSDAVKDADGKRIDFPTLVPTLTKDEVDMMVNDIIPNNKSVPDEIVQKAVDFARMRLANGMSVFANDGNASASENPPSAPAAPEQPEQPAQPGTEGQPPIQAGEVPPPPEAGKEAPSQPELNFGGGEPAPEGGEAPAGGGEGGGEGGGGGEGAPAPAGGEGGGEGGGGAPPPPPPEETPAEDDSAGGMAGGAQGNVPSEIEIKRKRGEKYRRRR